MPGCNWECGCSRQKMSRPIGLVTCDRFPDLHEDDQDLRRELAKRGFDVTPVIWDRWDRSSALPQTLILRTPWDYTKKYSAFLNFIERQEFENRALWNPPQILRWNLHKRYLLELAEDGLPVLPTVLAPVTYLEKVLQKIQNERPKGWPSSGDLVVKPAVGAGGYENQVLREGLGPLAAQCEAAKFTGGEVLIQPFWPTVSDGERSLLFFAGQFSHGVIKVPKSGEYRTQEQHGAEIRAYKPSAEELEFARQVVLAIPGRWLYARVDFLLSPSGQPTLMELELVEPSLFLATDPEASARYADAIARVL